ncbi:MAG: DUF4293 domain-containing protein [Bacteroidetes bacterium]|nr:DUF4293 domain-containing protein [Bacteroidota bacterium]
MIQRKQTLFLLQVAFLSICLLFVPVQFINIPQAARASLLPLNDGNAGSTMGHLAAIGLNALGLMLALVCIFSYKKRNVQVKLCYAIMAVYVILPLMMALCPFINVNGTAQKGDVNVFGYIVSAVCILSAYLAARFINKDIALIKSADRIR